ncbi:preprotein translocase subunit YajC [Pelagibius sp.]|uniref:preprotein translocase subunit YajC n=1 Tax=Pelagibius sp. TaxID=1931238 RepID=UPI00261D0FFD|nr:preprotein translocase subunit YajC [Pelagibius sp.]
MLISPAYAQAAGGGGADIFTSLLPIILIFVVFYFLLIRPQQKKVKQHRDMVQALRRGDKVVTGGGLIGTVTKVISDTEVQVELAEGVRVRVVKHTVQDVLSRTEAAPAKGGAPKAANDAGADKPKSLLGSLFGGAKRPTDKS